MSLATCVGWWLLLLLSSYAELQGWGLHRVVFRQVLSAAANSIPNECYFERIVCAFVLLCRASFYLVALTANLSVSHSSLPLAVFAQVTSAVTHAGALPGAVTGHAQQQHSQVNVLAV